MQRLHSTRSTRSTSRLTAALVLVAATALLAGCGDSGAHLPAGMSQSSAVGASGGATGIDVIDSAIGSDPGPMTTGVSTMVDDPVLAGYDGIDSMSTLTSDDVWSQAANDFTDSTGGSLGLDDDMNGDLVPAGYGGYGYGGDTWGSSYGIGNGILASGLSGWGASGWSGDGLLAASLGDAGMDPMLDSGLVDDPSMGAAMVDPGFDMNFGPAASDLGGFDMGGAGDIGFVDPGVDAGIADVGGFDAGGFDTGGFDTGGFDAGGFDTGGFDTGGFDTGGFDTGGFDTGGFDAGFGF